MEISDSDCLCDYLGNKKRLTDLFFPQHRNSVIPRHSNAYNEFWNFVQKFQKWMQSHCMTSAKSSNVLSRKRVRLNLLSVNYRLEDYIRHREADRPSSRSLSRRNLQCFHLIFDMYVDFLQKQKVARIMKLRRDQAALPMAAFRSQLLAQLATHHVVVVAGDTGCGKSTQVPQYLHAGELDADGQSLGQGYQHIAVTQPRRIACISLAARVSTEMLNELGSKVGYQVRFERTKTKATQIVFITEGLLLRQMQLDPFLKEYDALVLDEVHERHWQTDCLLGLVKCLVLARPELRVVLMSATINVKLFSAFFDDCPIIEVPGRLFPIDVKYVPLTPGEIAASGDRLDPSPYLRLLQRIDAKYPATERGDLLVFVPGMADIQAIMEPARAYAEQTKRWIILPLHSTLSAQDQEKVFHVAPDGVRKCVLSTNISETSLTIDGIRFVADSGRVKELSWDPTARMRRLKEFPISKASANQRKGRAGRTGPGVCFRLYSQEDYDQFESFSTPEIRRVPLETLVLQMMVMGLPDVKRFPFIEPPEEKSLDEAVQRLLSHGALVKTNPELRSKSEKNCPPSSLDVTSLGRLLADLPVEFSLGRMLIMASLLGLVEPVLSLVAGMSVQAPLAPMTSFVGIELARRVEALSEFESDHGDAFTVMNVFDEWIRIKSEATEGEDHRFGDHSKASISARRWCRRVGAQEQRLHEMVRLRSQFAQLLRDAGLWNPNSSAVRKSMDVHQRRDLNRARRTERLHTKRRRLLTLQDGSECRSDSEEDAESDSQHTSRLRKWLTAAGCAKSRKDTNNPMDVSVRDLELVLCYDLSSLAEYANRHGYMTQADLQLLKVVLAGGLYPHVAIGDTANAYRVANRGGTAGPGAEMVFHTRTKAFVTLHPNDVFVRNPDVLFPNPKSNNAPQTQSEDSQSVSILPSGYAYDHQLLMYLDLMETTRPFLVNTLRVPALPTLLLYSREVDTNENATRIVFDSWIEVCLVDVEAAQRSLATAVWLRTLMDRLMELQLANCSHRRELQATVDSGATVVTNPDDPPKHDMDPLNADLQRQCRQLRSMLGQSLASFLAGSAGGPYTLRRLLAADVKQLFRNSSTPQPQVNRRPSGTDASPALPEPDPHSGLQWNREKGGYKVTSYLTVDSLYTDDRKLPTDPVPQFGNSEEEHVNHSRNLAMRLLHQMHRASRVESLQSSTESSIPPDDDAAADEEEEEGRLESGSERYRCDRCNQPLPKCASFQTAILRHRRHCTAK